MSFEPAQWPVKSLGEITVNHDGKRRPVRESERKAGPFPYYGASGIVDYVNEFIFDGNYLLIAEDGENLRTRNTPIAFMAVGRFWVNNHAHIVTGTDEILTPYLMYFLRAADIQPFLTGAVMPKLTQGNLNRIPVRCPPIAVQASIIKVLGRLDAKIDLNRCISQSLEAMAQAIFKSWFVDFAPVRAKMTANQEGRDPLRAAMAVISGKADAQLDALPPERFASLAATAALFPDEMEESEFGEIPKGWKTTLLAHLTAKIGSGATPRGGKEVYLEDGVALIRSQNVYDSEFIWDGLARISDDAARQLRNVEVKSADVLLNITGASILRTCVVIPDVLPARVNQHVAIIRAKENIPPRYIHLHLLQRKTKDFLLGRNTGGSREAVTKAHIESTPIIQPSDAVLAAFQRVTHAVYLGSESLARQGKALSELRNTLLPKLLSGELAVNDTTDHAYLAGAD
jgi:type I restriction enzyme S subunit